MPTFPRNIGALPRLATPPRFPSGLGAFGQSGKGQFRSVQNMGRTWQEIYPVLDASKPSVRALIEAINRSMRQPIQWDVQHPYWHQRKGSGGGTPLVNGVGQTGSNLVVDAGLLQLLQNSGNLAAWAAVGGVTVTSGQADPFGGTGAYLVGDAESGTGDAIRSLAQFTADGSGVFSIFLKQGTSATTDLLAYDATLAQFRHLVRVTWGAGGVPTITSQGGSGPGAISTPEKWINGWYRFSFVATGLVAANVNYLYAYPAGSTASFTGTTYMFGGQALAGTTPASDYYWLRQGDIIQVAGCSVIFDVTGNVSTNNLGQATIPIHPPIFAGGSPADNAAVTIDPTAIYFKAYIADVTDYPQMDVTGQIDAGLTVTWREQPQ